MTTQYTLTTNLDQYTIIFNGWVGKHNIHDSTSAHTHPEFVAWLIEQINTGSFVEDEHFTTDCDYEDTYFEFYGQEVIDKAPFFIGEKGNEARGFQLHSPALISYTVENDEDTYDVLTNDTDELVELIEDNEDLFQSYLHCFGIYPSTECSITPTSHTYTYTLADLTHSGEVKDTMEQQLYATMADTLLEWTQWYDEWTFTDSHTMDTEGNLVFTWVFTHPPITQEPQPILTAV